MGELVSENLATARQSRLADRESHSLKRPKKLLMRVTKSLLGWMKHSAHEEEDLSPCSI
jgi:hypothetical protein